MLVRTGRCSLTTLEREGLSRGAVDAYVKIGFVEVEQFGEERYFSLHDAERLCRAERIRRQLGANLVGAALVVEVLERYGA
jgi:chaperone modulatory protein CbpM